MTKDEQRMAIGEACGYVWYRVPRNQFEKERRYRFLAHPLIHEYEDQSPLWLERADGTERTCNMEFMEKEGHLPDYPSDLNTMHEAERTLTIENFAAYENNLCAAVDRSGTGQLVRYRMHEVNVQRAVKEARRRIGIMVLPHELRHAYATHTLDRGVNVKALQQAMGHADVNTTMGYCHAEACSVKSPLDG